jgi:hypothetical protein
MLSVPGYIGDSQKLDKTRDFPEIGHRKTRAGRTRLVNLQGLD